VCIHFWIEKAAIELRISRPGKSNVRASEELIDGRMTTTDLHNSDASADALKLYSDLDRLFDGVEQRAGNPQSVFCIGACQTQCKFIVTGAREHFA
jgi:hypothetical protein